MCRPGAGTCGNAEGVTKGFHHCMPGCGWFTQLVSLCTRLSAFGLESTESLTAITLFHSSESHTLGNRVYLVPVVVACPQCHEHQKPDCCSPTIFKCAGTASPGHYRFAHFAHIYLRARRHSIHTCSKAYHKSHASGAGCGDGVAAIRGRHLLWCL